MEDRKIETLYHRLFNIAYNSDNIDIQDKSNYMAVLIAVDIYNSYKFEDETGVTTNLRWHLESSISANKAKKDYICDNNSNHKITIGDFYGNINVDAINRNPEKLCLTCLDIAIPDAEKDWQGGPPIIPITSSFIFIISSSESLHTS